MTDADGTFEYSLFDQVSFSIGDIDLGTAAGAPYLTPVEMTNSPDPTAQAALNMLIFLQSVDVDSNPDNGIRITAATREAAVGQSLNFNSPNFQTEAAAVLAAIAPGNELISAEEALNNFYETYRDLGGTDTLNFPFPGYPPVGAVQYELIFADEFNTGAVPNPEIWNYDLGYGEWIKPCKLFQLVPLFMDNNQYECWFLSKRILCF